MTSETVSLQAESAQTSYLKWTVSPSTASVTLDLTDDTGKSYYYDEATSSPVEYSPSAPAAAVSYTASVALDTSETSGTTFKQAYMQMYDDHPIILLKIDVGADVRADTEHTAANSHAYDTDKGVDIFYQLTEQAITSQTSISATLNFTISVKGHDGGEALASAGELYDTGIVASVGYATAVDGTGFTAFGTNYPA